ncbi:MAG: hypothetical protein GF309_01625 [Candidatus Lokiarchaeota archaeon]|nr:hypothetical protein [Candidatus Lokiarchaeota archaeon]
MDHLQAQPITMTVGGAVEQYVNELVSAARNDEQVSSTVSDIRYTERELRETQRRLKDVKEDISTWDRVNILTKTPAETEEERLSEETKAMRTKLRELKHQFHFSLLRVIDTLAAEDSGWLALRVELFASKLVREISNLTIDYGVLGMMNYMDHSDDTIQGQERCLNIASRLDEFVTNQLGGDINLRDVLEKTKRRLVNDIW